MDETIWPLTSPRPKRISGSKNFRSTPQKDFCNKIRQKPPLHCERGPLFVGIDVIDGNLTEINVTSPSGIRAIARLGGPDVAAMIWDSIEAKRGKS